MKRMFRRRIRQVPGLNTTSTADISFMLLIFFLVASSMDVDKGIAHQLPPADTKREQKEAEVDRQDLLLLTITADNRLLADGEPLSPGQAGGRIERFIEERGAAHLIQVDADPAAAYDVYFQLQNTLAIAYRHWRDAMSRRKFGRGYGRLTPVERDRIRELCPQRISETYHVAAKGGPQ